MKKIFLIGMKDVRLAFRDRPALIMMLLAPFLLTIGLGFVTGRFSGGSNNSLKDIPVVLINQDNGALGRTLLDVFQSPELSGLLQPTVMTDTLRARQLVDDDEFAALVVVPQGFTDSQLPGPAGSAALQPAVIHLYANPGRPTGAAVIQSIIEEFLGRIEAGRIGSEVTIRQLLANNLVSPTSGKLQQIGSQAARQMGANEQAETLIKLKEADQGKAAVDFDILAYMAPGMALMFLMYTTTYGGRSILLERSLGTLPRLLVSPTSSLEVMAGKVLGTFLTGLAQIAILIGATTLFFNVKWGDPLGIGALIVAAVFAATGWGMLLTAVAHTPGQVASFGSALMLTFGILGGSFVNLSNLPVWLQWLSKITPNAWGLDGFGILAQGGSLADLGAPLAGLGVMGAVLFAVAVSLFNRQALVQR